MTILLDHNMEVWHNKMLDQGRAEGERDMLLRWATSLFGTDIAEQIAALLSRVDDPERIARAGETLVKCKTGAEFLSRVERDLG